MILFWVEEHHLQWHKQQSYLGEINDKCDIMVNIYWKRKGISEHTESILLLFVMNDIFEVKFSVYFGKQELYDYTYGNLESVLY